MSSTKQIQLSSRQVFKMKIETKKSIVFRFVLAVVTSAYAAFLNTVMKQGFLTEHFFINWLGVIPRTFMFLFPFVLITGPLVKLLIDRMFRNPTKKSNDHIENIIS